MAKNIAFENIHHENGNFSKVNQSQQTCQWKLAQNQNASCKQKRNFFSYYEFALLVCGNDNDIMRGGPSSIFSSSIGKRIDSL